MNGIPASLATAGFLPGETGHLMIADQADIATGDVTSQAAKVLAVNVGMPCTVRHEGRSMTTGIFKSPVAGAVSVGSEGLDGDGQADLKVHGGPDMAVYAYPHEHYAYWSTALKMDDMPNGQFGENLTTEGLLEDEVMIGDRLRIGTAMLEVSQPRWPCSKLAMRLDQEKTFANHFREVGRFGFYLRVLNEGELSVGDSIELIDRDPTAVSIATFIETYVHDQNNLVVLQQVLQSRGLSAEWRDRLTRHIQRRQ